MTGTRVPEPAVGTRRGFFFERLDWIISRRVVGAGCFTRRKN